MSLKIGDRVRVYGNTDRAKDDPMYAGNPIAYHRGSVGVVDLVLWGEELSVKILPDESRHYKKSYIVTVHAKQCRKLRKVRK